VPLSPSPIHMHQYTVAQAVDFMYLKNVLLKFLEIPPLEARPPRMGKPLAGPGLETKATHAPFAKHLMSIQ
jgi:hypothetical protein